jgi:23S rRNA maturation-related 3'-5' exoribonuclease YhaM
MIKEERIAIYKTYEDKFYDAIPASFLDRLGFFDAPASRHYHGAYPGGLFDHSLAVCERLIRLTKDNHLVWRSTRSPFVVGMYHDLCKCDLYVMKDNGEYDFNPNLTLKEHGAKSVMILAQYMQLTEEEVLCIRYHMGAYEKEEWAEFDHAIRAYQTVLWTHTADMLASKTDGV